MGCVYNIRRPARLAKPRGGWYTFAAMSSPGLLYVVGGTDRGKRFDLTPAETRIGRGADQDVVLSDIAVSRRHITVHAEGGRFRLRDLGSGNGTLVNGARIDSVILNDGDHIELGNTVLRFNQAGAPATAAPPAAYGAQGGFSPPPAAGNFGAPPPAYQPPPQQPAYQPPPQAAYTPPPPQQPAYQAPAPINHAATQAPFMVGSATQAPYQPAATQAPVERPADMPRMAARPIPSVGRRQVSRGPLDSTGKKVVVFGTMGILCVAGAGVIVSRTVMARPQVVSSDAEESYKQGVRLFIAGDYDGAKINFNDAATQAPDAPEPKRYAHQCDAELRGRGALKSAERSVAGRRYGEALRSLEQVEDGTFAHDQSVRMRREILPKAAGEEVDEARRVMASDPAAAQARLAHALELDPSNVDARALMPKIKGGKPPVAVAVAPVAPPAEHHSHAVKEDDTPRPTKVAATPKATPAPPPDKGAPAAGLDTAKGAMALYKNKDFAGAIKAATVEAMSQSPKQSDKTMALVTQIKMLRADYDRAVAEEGSRPAEAVKDYNEAMAIDAKVGKGVHASFFKGRIGKVQLSSAQQAFAAGKYDQAYSSVQLAQKYGAGDGGMLKQLESKAGELVSKGQSVQKSNAAQAKTYWRQVLKMVPTSSPTYAKAYGLVNAASGAHKDEDED